MVFAGQLARAKRTGLGEYGVLAQRYTREFDAKWIRGGRDPDEPLVGSADIQSLADLGNSFEVIKTMRLVPFSKETVFQLGVVTLIPLAATPADDDLARRAVETSAECRVLSKPRFSLSANAERRPASVAACSLASAPAGRPALLRMGDRIGRDRRR